MRKQAVDDQQSCQNLPDRDHYPRLITMSSRYMRKSFESTRYRFTNLPERHPAGDFGIYVHVPLCPTLCSFCPFYKETFSEDRKNQYLAALIQEINTTNLQGTARWVYIGGGSPNILTVVEWEQVVSQLNRRVQLNSVGIELLPALLTEEYLRGLKDLGFSKVSIGIESFAAEVIEATNRTVASCQHTSEMVQLTASLGFWINIDLMVGLQHQDQNTFLEDVAHVIQLGPAQVTLYPYMVIRGHNARPAISSGQQFEWIEEAGAVLEAAGYRRRGVWTFARGEDLYDSSRDELVIDYVGFGPGAFSTCQGWKMVNPDLATYCENHRKGVPRGFVARESSASKEWRKFARQVYDLNGSKFPSAAAYIRLYWWLLKLGGYRSNGTFTCKGRLFAHEITKIVVESLPFPLQNPQVVTNYDEYVALKQKIRAR